MLRVWHSIGSLVGPSSAPLRFPYDYTRVAEVDTTIPGEAFELTNHIHHDWTRNARVKKLTTGPVRSTSVGDIIEDLDGGALLLVRGIGFGRMEPLDPVTWDACYALD